jgi:GDP-mannose 6-dehydrogenase
VVVCPEFLREGTAIKDFAEPSLAVVGTRDGLPPKHAGLLRELTVIDPRVLPWAGAEMIKYSCNFFHATKVAFANEIGRLSRHLGIDGREVMAALCDDRRLNISSYYLRPGNPFGGSCLPKDVSALGALARQEGVALPLLESVLPTNKVHLDTLLAQIDAHQPRRVAILGLTFKADTDDLRGSPMVAVAETLLGRGVELAIYDPWINPANLIGANERDIRQRMPHLGRLLKESPCAAIEGADVVVVSQRCADLDELERLVGRDQVVIDVNGWPALEALTDRYEGSCW